MFECLIGENRVKTRVPAKRFVKSGGRKGRGCCWGSVNTDLHWHRWSGNGALDSSQTVYRVMSTGSSPVFTGGEKETLLITKQHTL